MPKNCRPTYGTSTLKERQPALDSSFRAFRQTDHTGLFYHLASLIFIVTERWKHWLADAEDCDIVDPRYFYYVNDGVYGAMCGIVHHHDVVQPQLLNVCTCTVLLPLTKYMLWCSARRFKPIYCFTKQFSVFLSRCFPVTFVGLFFIWIETVFVWHKYRLINIVIIIMSAQKRSKPRVIRKKRAGRTRQTDTALTADRV